MCSVFKSNSRFKKDSKNVSFPLTKCQTSFAGTKKGSTPSKISSNYNPDNDSQRDVLISDVVPSTV
jgi:hypothetical protein